MIIQTRYRDIPGEVVKEVHNGMPGEFRTAFWSKRRGQPIQIIAPSYGVGECGAACFHVVDDPAGETAYACEHIAEIGD